MKAQRHKSVIGLVIGERSILAAEVHRAERPEVRKTAEFSIPPELSFDAPVPLGKAISAFLRSAGFSAKAVVIGLPARKVVVKAREVPPADTATLNDLLRLQAEGEFAAELKDLVYDYQREENSTSVLLMATPRTHMDSVLAATRSAGLRPVCVTATALALGAATGRSQNRNSLVLSINAYGAEITSQHKAHTAALRHMRMPENPKAFAGELRRAVMSLTQDTTGRELLVWSAVSGFDAALLNQSTSLVVRTPEVSTLGVRTLTPVDPAYASAVATALVALSDIGHPINFLHSKLAPPRERVIPRWAVLAAAAVIIVGGLGYYGYSELRKETDAVVRLSKQLADAKPTVERAQAFVSTISFAETWHRNEARYLGALRAVTNAFPDDGQTYCVNMTIRELPKPPAGSKKPVDHSVLTGTIFGKTSDQRRAQDVLSSLKRSPFFSDVKIVGIQDVGRQQVSFTINFTYRPPEFVYTVPPPPPGSTTRPAAPPPSSASVRVTP